VYAGGTLTLANCKITTTVAHSSGIKLANAGAVAIIGLVTFNVPQDLTGAGRAVLGVSGTYLYYSSLYFLPDGVGGTTNRRISSAISAATINTTPDFVA
jgi:hypothetical protein